MNPELLARVDACLRPYLTRLPRTAVSVYSAGRQGFLGSLVNSAPAPYRPPPELERCFWGLTFRSPLGNAAGIFKNGEGYELVASQGAGWYLAGTTTAEPRTGNHRHGVDQPFAPYPRSRAASNWLGLPNDGHAAVAARLARVERQAGCPVGASAAAVGGGPGAVEELITGLELYEKAGVDFLEINESCPNTEEGAPQESALAERLEAVAAGFLRRRRRPLPVIVKFSTDTALEQVPDLLDLLVQAGFDGVNFGNTSTDYAGLRPAIDAAERPLFDYFTEHFGGGVSGQPLAGRSLALVRAAAKHLRRHPPDREFHVVRTGGVESADDLRESETVGAALSQWYTGYFEAFSQVGHEVYRRLYESLLEAEGETRQAAPDP